MPIILDTIARWVLAPSQQKLLPLLEEFSSTHFLAGGTAIALQLWHRESIDFDFFSRWSQWSFADFFTKIQSLGFDVSDEDKERYAGAEFVDQDEIHVTINWVNVSLIDFSRTLYNYQEIRLEWTHQILGWLRVASLLELACMKVYAMITRSTWKDAVDLYFLLNHLGVALASVLDTAETIYYIRIFNRAAILEQLISRKWDTTESVKYLIDKPPQDSYIIDTLSQEALQIL